MLLGAVLPDVVRNIGWPRTSRTSLGCMRKHADIQVCLCRIAFGSYLVLLLIMIARNWRTLLQVFKSILHISWISLKALDLLAMGPSSSVEVIVCAY